MGVALPTSDQADLADLVQIRHRRIDYCREVLAWLGVATRDMQEECAELCQRCTELPARIEKRLSVMLKTAAATATEERSAVVRRLYSISKSWEEEVPQRRRRYVTEQFRRLYMKRVLPVRAVCLVRAACTRGVSTLM